MATVNKQSTRVDYSQLADSLTTNTPVNDAFGTNGKLYFLFVKSAGGGTDYFKLYDTKSQVTGTSLPSFIFPITGGASEVFHFPEGVTFTEGVGYAGCNAGGTGLGANPSGTLTVQMVFK